MGKLFQQPSSLPRPQSQLTQAGQTKPHTAGIFSPEEGAACAKREARVQDPPPAALSLGEQQERGDSQLISSVNSN